MKISKYIKEAVRALKDRKLKWVFLGEILTYVGLLILLTIFGAMSSSFFNSMGEISRALLSRISIFMIFILVVLASFWYVARFFLWQYINGSKFNKNNFWGGLVLNLIYTPIFFYLLVILAIIFFYNLPTTVAIALGITSKYLAAIIIYVFLFVLGIPFLYVLNINNIFFDGLTSRKNLANALKQFKYLWKNFPKSLNLFFYIVADFFILSLILILVSMIPLIGSIITLFIYVLFNSWSKLLIKRVLLK